MLLKAYPTLYKRNSNQKIQIWDVSVVDMEGIPFIQTQYGVQDGKIQITRDPITEGKNLGKANATDPKKQALNEAKAKWKEKQAREGYVEKLEEIDVDLRDGVSPMLAHRYDKYPDKIEFPCFMQPKLDGHRMIAIVTNKGCQLFSRKRNLITGLPHINDALSLVFSDGLEDGQSIILDGEGYNHAFHKDFESITGWIRSQEPKEGYENVQYHIYDLVNSQLPYYDRHSWLEGISTHFKDHKFIKFVETKEVILDDVVPTFKEFVAQGYEGGMLRNFDGMYVSKRSTDLLKVKEFQDDDFEIVGFSEGRGKLKGHAIFQCLTKEGNTFDVKLKGSTALLKEIFENIGMYLGKKLTVQFQGYTNKGIPRFPVGVRVREDV